MTDEQSSQACRTCEDRATTPHVSRHVAAYLATCPCVATIQRDDGNEEADRTDYIICERDSSIYEGLPADELKAMPAAKDAILGFWRADASRYRRANYKYRAAAEQRGTARVDRKRETNMKYAIAQITDRPGERKVSALAVRRRKGNAGKTTAIAIIAW